MARWTLWVALAAAMAFALIWALTPPAHAETGIASFYGAKFHGRKTASGERFDMNAATCASRKYRFGTRLKVINQETGKSATCRVNDRGPYSGGRILDVSRSVAARLGMIQSGTARVRITRQ